MHQRLVGEVRENAQVRPRLCNAADERCHLLADRVDEVGTHGVAGIDEQVHDHHVAARRPLVVAHRHAADATAALDEVRVHGIRGFEHLLARGLERRHGGARVVHVEQLDLPDHQRRIGPDAEAARGARELGRRGQRGDDRRLLDHHRHEAFDAVDLEVQCHGERQARDADDVLDEVLRHVTIERDVAAR